jgi:sulfonate dioxygenase
MAATVTKLSESVHKLNVNGEEEAAKTAVIKADESADTQYPNLRFSAYAPTFDPSQKYAPLEVFDFKDPGLLADEKLANLFPKGLPESDEDARASASQQLVKFGYSVKDLSPKFGTEVQGIQLSQLSDSAKNDLALYVAERGVVVFRDQDFRELPIEQALKYASHFGRHHIHPTSGSPKDFPEVHLVYRDPANGSREIRPNDRVSSVSWHSDVTYEKQPPGTTFLGILELPVTGGDTVFTDTEEVYNRLSEEFKNRLKGLKAVHSAHEQAEYSRKRGGVVRREPVKNAHPVVRTHPVTKKNALFVNTQFTRYIEGFKQEESEYLLNFLYSTIGNAHEAQIRAKWEDGTVVVWDNRRAVHTGIFDWGGEQKRHLFRYTPQADVPTEAL